LRNETVAGTAYGLDGSSSERFVNLATEAPYVDLDDVRIAVELVFPHAREDLTLGHDTAGAAEQKLQYLELTSRQRDLGITTPYAPRTRVEMQVANV